jgi:hypothetical protein
LVAALPPWATVVEIFRRLHKLLLTTKHTKGTKDSEIYNHKVRELTILESFLHSRKVLDRVGCALRTIERNGAPGARYERFC